MKYYPDCEDLKTRLIDRGKRWAGMQGMHHLFYDGLAFRWNAQERKHKKQTVRAHDYFVTSGHSTSFQQFKSRVMIDRATFAKSLPNYMLPIVIKALTGEDIDKHPRKLNALHGKPAEVDECEALELSDDELMLASPIVYGFSLSNKSWCMFFDSWSRYTRADIMASF